MLPLGIYCKLFLLPHFWVTLTAKLSPITLFCM